MKTIAFAPSDASKLVAALVAGKSPASLGLGSRPPGALRPAPELPSKIKSNAPARAGLPPPSTPPPAPAAGPKPTASKAAALASPTSATAKQPASSLPTSPSAFDPQTARDIAFSDTDESPEADADVAAEAMTNFRLAEAALQRNDTAAALALAQKAAAGDPSQFDYVTLLAWVKALGGNPSAMEQSIKTLTRVLIEDPSNERALLYRGKLFARTSRLQEALNDFGDLVSANPEHREAQMELRLVKQRIG
jgi:tetratricopeptide (TPR) repeat protein